MAHTIGIRFWNALLIALLISLGPGCGPPDAKDLQRALGENPGSVDERVALAESLLQRGRYSEAAALADKNLQASPDSVPFLKTASKVYAFWFGAERANEEADNEEAIQRLYEKAARYCHRLVELGAADADVYGRLGWLEMVMGNYQPEAIEAFQSALALDSAHAFSLRGQGQLFTLQGKYEEAVPLLTRSAELVEKTPGLVDDPYVNWQLLGMAQRLLGDYRAAVTNLEKALQSAPSDKQAPIRELLQSAALLAKDAPNVETFNAYRKLGEEHSWKGRRDLVGRIRARNTAAVGPFRARVEQRPNDPAALYDLGCVLCESGDFEGALPVFKKCTELLAADSSLFAEPYRVWYGLGDVQRMLAQYEAALASMKKAEALCPPGVEFLDEMYVYTTRQLLGARKSWEASENHTRLAERHLNLGRPLSAIVEFERAIDLDPGTNGEFDAGRRLINFTQLFECLRETKQPDKLLEMAEKMAVLCKDTDDPSALAVAYDEVLDALGAVSSREMDQLRQMDPSKRKDILDKRIKLCDLAQEYYRKAGGRDDEQAEDLDYQRAALIAEAYGVEDPRVVELRQRIHEELPQEGDILDREFVLMAEKEAHFLELEHNDEGALQLYLRMAKYNDVVCLPDSEGVADFNVDLATLLYECRGIAAVPESVKRLEKALAVCNAIRNRFGTDEFKRNATAGYAYQHACCWLVYGNTLLKEYEKAFYYGEQYKGRALLDLLGSSAVFTKRRAVKEREDQQRLKLARIEELKGQLDQARKSDSGEAVRGLERDLTLEQTAYQRLAEDVSVATLELANVENVQVPKWDDIRPIVKGFTLLNYVVTPDEENTVIVASEDGVIAVPLAEGFHGSEFADLVEGFRNEIGVKTDVARDLTIEAPTETAVPEAPPKEPCAQKLFEILIAPILPYLKTELVYISTYDVLNYVPFEALRHKNGRYFIEDHAVAYTPSASVLKLCMAKERHRRDSVLALGNPNLRNPAFRLVHAENEVNAIVGMFPKADVYIQDDATETLVKERASQYDILHFACHGELNVDEPMLASLRLAPDDRNDGYLHAGEVFELGLSPSLIVLSACNSALGKLSTGNELAGLTRSFLYAGAPSIIASLWVVDDKSTALLMQQFYKNLGVMNKAEALRQAKLTIMQDYPSPFHWAPLCLQGDYR